MKRITYTKCDKFGDNILLYPYSETELEFWITHSGWKQINKVNKQK